MSNRQSLGLSVIFSDPLARSGRAAYIDTLSHQLNGYRHSIGASIGYDTATITLGANREVAEAWLNDGVGRHIVVRDYTLTTIWEGFVNRINATIGGQTEAVGELLNIGNKVKAIFSTVDTSTTPPTLGVRESTDWAEDSDSQDRYGIFEVVVSTGGASTSEAEQYRDKFLEENKRPKSTSQNNIAGGQNNISVSLECLGYYHLLKTYTYNSTTTGGQNLSTKLQNILTSQPDSLYSADYSQVTSNTFQVAAWENNDDTAESLVKGLIAFGDSSDNRYTFGIYAGRKAIYQQAPTEVDYRFSIASNSQQIEGVTGGRVYPWQVLPGRWLRTPDFLIGRVQSTLTHEDPRNRFIESVEYTAPWGLSINGTQLETLPQLLAKLQLGGVAE